MTTTEACEKCEGRGFIVGVLPSEPPCPNCLGDTKTPRHRCSRCGHIGVIVNECRCDPDNLPTDGDDMEHTPGPWNDTGLPIKWGTRYINEENGFAIARVFMRQDRRVSNEVVTAEMLANARLIAAAPALLEGMLKRFEGSRNHFNAGDNPTIKQARSVIASIPPQRNQGS